MGIRERSRTGLIVATLAAGWGICPAELVSPSRSPRLVLGRQVVVQLSRELLGLSWAEATAVKSRADHTIAMHAEARLRARLGCVQDYVARPCCCCLPSF